MLRLALALLLTAAPLPALGQQLGGATDPEISVVRIVAALTLCIAAAFALALLIGKRGIPSRFWGSKGLAARLQRRGRVEVIETRRLSAHADLCLVRCDTTEYLLACAQGEVRILAQTALVPDPSASDEAS